ncbi:hypothetical protein HPP92_002125 [Vanilla planifolia]|uniref:Peptidase A1 domain-containing protein n=1 Tax=Vanilla planifolia TaxID=51239 RepID=A0A835RSV2_VANPL|nr:hypothetical protein HPP92_002125 [Vanilla planifolia]
MRFSIGTPPVSVLAVMDTGSDLTWFRCTPAPTVSAATSTVFHPTASSTYETLPLRFGALQTARTRRVQQVAKLFLPIRPR